MFSTLKYARLRILALLIALCFLASVPFANAQATLTNYPDTLQFFKNYFVTGDYVVHGVGLRGLGDASGLAKGYIQVGDVPQGAVVVAAYLYWETIESTSTPSSQNGFFQGYPIVGLSRGTGTSPCWSSGGGTGSSNGSKTLRVYRADVAPFLVVNGQYQTNTTSIPNFPGYEVRLPDSGSNGAGTPLTEGASLVIVYRLLNAPLRAVVFYDGSWTMNNSTQFMSQTLDWFYQAKGSANAHLTHIVGDGQANFGENIYFKVGTTTTKLNSQAGFVGAEGLSWDDPVYTVTNADGTTVPKTQNRQSPVATYVEPDASSFDCLSWGAVIYSTPVIDTDNDGLLDVWETKQGYWDSKSGALPTAAANLSDPNWVQLPGAVNGTRDIFAQVDYLQNSGATSAAQHSHLPRLDALKAISTSFSSQGIHMHFDVGAKYPSSTKDANNWQFIMGSGAIGGNSIDEDTYSCHDSGGDKCDFPFEASLIPGIVSWKTGVLSAKNQFFPHGRNQSYHYILDGHALGFPDQTWSVPDGTLTGISVSNGVATVTTSTDNLLPAGSRVSISGAIGDYNLNGAYDIVTPGQSFTINTPNVANGQYGLIAGQALGWTQINGLVQSNEPNLTLSTGAPVSISGFSDLGGGDSVITLGLWKSDDASGCQADPSVPLSGTQVYCNNMVGTTTVQAGTIMHELGHTLYLTHGGYYPATSTTSAAFGQNCKPNFLSVMNYLFQIRGLPNANGYGIANVDYSGQFFNNLDETNLIEANGLGYDSTHALPKYGTRFYGPPSYLDNQAMLAGQSRLAQRHCDGTPLNGETAVRIEAATVGVNSSGVQIPAPIDWNNKAPANETVVDQDINLDGFAEDNSETGFNDWSNLNLQQVGSRRNIYGFSADVSSADIGGSGLKILGGGLKILGGGSDLINGGSQLLGSGLKILGGGTKILGGGLKILGGGLELDYDTANSIVEPPTLDQPKQTGKTTVALTWHPPDFGQIRTYYVYRATVTKYPMSSTNPPALLATLTGSTFATTYSDNTVKSNQTYLYFVTAGLIVDNSPNSGRVSGPSNFTTITVK